MKHEKQVNQSPQRLEKKNWVKIGVLFLDLQTFIGRTLDRYLTLKSFTIHRYGKTFTVRGSMEYFLYWKWNWWERNTHRIFDKFLDPTHSYIDIGAFIGPTVLYGAHIAKKVYALEPDPIAFKELKKNISLNPVLQNKIEVHQQCLNTYTGKVAFGNMSFGGDTTSSLLFGFSKTSWTVDGITFNDFLQENAIFDCNFIKMDIEGGELLVLPTMKKYLQREKPVLYVSLHQPFYPHPHTDTNAVLDVLRVYDHVFADDGKEISLDELCKPASMKRFYAILATDTKW
jgi:FkbM family methyltransferase